VGKGLGKGLGKVRRARFRAMQTLTALPAEAVTSGLSAPRPVRPPVHTRGLVGALNAEWRLRSGEPLPAAWTGREPALADCRSLGEVVEAAGRRGHDEALRAVLRLARDGDDTAARTALQVMLGAAVRLARRTVAHAQGDLEESLSRAVGALWQVVRDYPVDRRTCRPADGISLDVLAALTGAGRPRPREVPAGLPTDLGDTPEEDHEPGGLRGLFWAQAAPRAARACSDEQLLLVLAWGVRRGVVTAEDARLLVRLHSPRHPGAGVSCREVADELGLAHAAVRQRASRTTRRLAAAVTALAQGDLQDAVAAA
jgi:hypothetical protein